MIAPNVCWKCRRSLRFKRSYIRNIAKRYIGSLNELVEDRTIQQKDALQKNTSFSNHSDNSANAPITSVKSQRLRYSGRPLNKSVLTNSEGRQPRDSPSAATTWSLNDFASKEPSPRSERVGALFGLLKEAQNASSDSQLKVREVDTHQLLDRQLRNLDRYNAGVGQSSEAWEALENIYANKSRLNMYDQTVLQRSTAIASIFPKFISIGINNASLQSTPSFSRFIEIIDSIGCLNPRRLHSSFRVVIRTILEKLYKEQKSEEAALLTKELLLSWKYTIDKFISPKSIQRSSRDAWDGLPSGKDIEKNLKQGKSYYYSGFKILFPGTFTQETFAGNFAASSLATLFCFQILRARGFFDTEFVTDMKPFTDILSYLVTRSGDAKPNIITWRATRDLFEYIRSDWREFRNLCRHDVSVNNKDPRISMVESQQEASQAEVLRPENFNQRAGLFYSDLRKAVKEEDVRFIHKLWGHHEESCKGMSKRFLQMVYNEFLHAFVHLNRIEAASVVWRQMNSVGIEPTMENWVTMLKACRKQKDPVSLANLWAKIRDSGMPITNSAWNVYIGALTYFKDWSGVDKSIIDMAETWDSRSVNIQSDKDTTGTEADFEPSIIPLNTAIEASYKRQRPDIATLILKFARERGIAPNIETFNIRLKHAVRGLDFEEVQKILKDLKQSSCTPDIATFTTLIDGTFRNKYGPIGIQGSTETQAQIEQLFSDMKTSGIKPTSHTYATILDALLPSRSKHVKNTDFRTARAVLDHMSAEGVRLTPHICTILITHYFNSDPPNLDAVEALWERMEAEGTVPDHVFFDRMIENYARLRETRNMMRFMRMMVPRGKIPGWISLVEAVDALVDTGELGAANEVVRSVEKQEKLGRLGIRRGWKGEQAWHELVDRLRGKGIIEPRVVEPSGETKEVRDGLVKSQSPWTEKFDEFL